MPAQFRYDRDNITAAGTLTQLHPPAPYVWFDFLQDAVADLDALTITQSGTAITALAVSSSVGDPVAGHGGWVTGSTDDVDAESDEYGFGALTAAVGSFRSDQAGKGLLVCEIAMSIPAALTTRQYFAGLSDDSTEGSGAIAINVASGTTVTDTATDAAGWNFSSTATDATHWCGVSTDSGTQSTITQGPTAVADTWVGLRVEVDTAGEVFYGIRSKRGGDVVLYGKSNQGVSPDVLLAPYFGASPTTTTTVPYEIDYVWASCGTVA
jgi:hypothetical protein